MYTYNKTYIHVRARERVVLLRSGEVLNRGTLCALTTPDDTLPTSLNPPLNRLALIPIHPQECIPRPARALYTCSLCFCPGAIFVRAAARFSVKLIKWKKIFFTYTRSRAGWNNNGTAETLLKLTEKKKKNKKHH